MPLSDNPYRLKVELNTDKALVAVTVLKRDDDSVVETAEFPAADVAATLRLQVGLYGLSKLLQDRTSEVPAGPGKVAAMRDLNGQLKLGVWEKERKIGAPVVSAEVEALAELKGISVAEAQGALRGYSKEVRVKILAHPTIVAKAAEVRAKRGTATGVSLDDSRPRLPARTAVSLA